MFFFRTDNKIESECVNEFMASPLDEKENPKTCRSLPYTPLTPHKHRYTADKQDHKQAPQEFEARLADPGKAKGYNSA